MLADRRYREFGYASRRVEHRLRQAFFWRASDGILWEQALVDCVFRRLALGEAAHRVCKVLRSARARSSLPASRPMRSGCSEHRGDDDLLGSYDWRIVEEGWRESSDRAAAPGSWPRESGTRYSTTWSARSRSVCGIVTPSAFAVLRLMTSSNFVGCSTGRSAGLAPLRILST